MNIFTDEFVASAKSILAEGCAARGVVTRAELCKALNLSDRMLPVVSALHQEGFLADYEARLGRNGGFVAKGQTQPKAERAAKKFDDAFLANLTRVLDENVPQDPKQAVKRSVLAAALGTPGSDTEARISEALAEWAVPGYGCRKGPGGGVCRVSAPKTRKGKGKAPEAEVEVTAEGETETVETAATEAPAEVDEVSVEASAEPAPEAETPAEAAAPEPVAEKPAKRAKSKKAAKGKAKKTAKKTA